MEEAFFQAKGLVDGVNLKGGRFLSGIGYLNSQHAHAWDFVDAPLAYQAFLGGQYKQDGLQAKWLAPTDTFVELAAEIGNGGSFPGTARDKNGINAASVSAHVGGDFGTSSSWRAGLSWLHTRAEGREQTELDGSDYSFSGRSNLWIADAIYKWAPGGNGTSTSIKLQGEYFRRTENGTLTQASDSGSYAIGRTIGMVRARRLPVPAELAHRPALRPPVVRHPLDCTGCRTASPAFPPTRPAAPA